MKKLIISFICIFVLFFSFVTYLLITNSNLYSNTDVYLKTVKSSVIKEIPKLKGANYSIEANSKLHDTTLIPYFDKANMNLKREIDVIINNGNKSVVAEVFEFNKSDNIKYMYSFMVNKTQYKIDEKNKKLIFINLSGAQGDKVRLSILNSLTKNGISFR